MDHHITHMDADAKPELPVLRNPLVLLPQPLLYLHRTLDRIDHTRELREHTVARRVRYAAPVLGYEPVHDLPVSRERPQRPYLVPAHEPRITRHVSREDGCELAFDWLGGFRHGSWGLRIPPGDQGRGVGSSLFRAGSRTAALEAQRRKEVAELVRTLFQKLSQPRAPAMRACYFSGEMTCSGANACLRLPRKF